MDNSAAAGSSAGTWTSPILAGLAGGVGIFVCYALAYGITDGLITR